MPADSTGPPDRQTLRLLERRFADEPLVATTAFDPNPYEPRLLRVTLDENRYPPTVERATLDIRWFISGDFSIHYLETQTGSDWECRWDCHPNRHNARCHFHRPPDCSECVDISFQSTHPLEIYSVVLGAVERRLSGH